MKRLSAEIEQRRDDLVETTCELVRIPTLNPPGNHYRDICDFLEARLARSGFSSTFVRAEGVLGDSEKHPRWNIVSRHEGAKNGDCVHFNSHTDVVKVGEGWTRDPFGGEVEGDKIYGRGACDMKGGLAASIIAAEAFIAAVPEYQGAIEISGTADEETGGFAGVAHLAEEGWFDPDRVQHVIIPEPLNKDQICLGHRGVWWAEIETHGEIAHGSMPFLGDCAVRHMGAVLEKFESDLYPAMAARRTDMPVVPQGAQSSTMNINSIHGGQPELDPDYTGLPAHCVPDSCRIVIDCWRLPLIWTVHPLEATVLSPKRSTNKRAPHRRSNLARLHQTHPFYSHLFMNLKKQKEIISIKMREFDKSDFFLYFCQCC